MEAERLINIDVKFIVKCVTIDVRRLYFIYIV